MIKEISITDFKILWSVDRCDSFRYIEQYSLKDSASNIERLLDDRSYFVQNAPSIIIYKSLKLIPCENDRLRISSIDSYRE